jgi:hypothetical protein
MCQNGQRKTPLLAPIDQGFEGPDPAQIPDRPESKGAFSSWHLWRMVEECPDRKMVRDKYIMLNVFRQ